MYKSKKDIILEDEKMIEEMFPDKKIVGEIMLSIHKDQYNVAVYDASDDTLIQENDVDKTNNSNYEKEYKVHED